MKLNGLKSKLLMLLSVTLFANVSSATDLPWWNNWPRVTFDSSLDGVQKTNANFVNAVSGAADEGRGPYFREVALDDNKALYDSLTQMGVKKLAWLEGQGESRSIIAAINKLPDGSYKIDPTYGAAQIIAHNWTWDYTGPGKSAEANTVVWLGLQSFADNESWLGPFTRNQIGMSLPTYPDGTPATGFLDNSNDPRKAKLYDGLGSKGLLGKIPMNGGDTGTNAQGKIPVDFNGVIKPVGDFSEGKDIASPWWLEYTRTAVRALLKRGMDGFWVDNYSGFDSISSWPINNSFGEWSVAGFKKYLSDHPGIVANPATFDIRTYLKNKFQEKVPNVAINTTDGFWSDPYWLTDRVWHGYMSYKSDVSGQYAKDLYQVIKSEAVAAGKDPDQIYVGGNDIPVLSFAAMTGDQLDMVNTEYTTGWSLDTGSVGRGLPIDGGVGAGTFHSIATQFAKSKHAVVWHYLEGSFQPYLKKTGLGVFLGFEALAHNSLLNGGVEGGNCAGTDESQGEVNRFVQRMAPVFGDRHQTGKVAILYSTQTQHYFLAPGGFVGFDWNQTSDPNKDGYLDHNLGVYGWGSLFENKNIPYVMIPDFKLSAASLQNVSVLVVPHVLSMDQTVITQTLVPFIAGGGTVIVTGKHSGLVKSKKYFYEKNSSALLYALTTKTYPKGRAIFIDGNPGFDYYIGRQNPSAAQYVNSGARMKKTIDDLIAQGALSNEFEIYGFNSKVRSTLNKDASTGRTFIDLLNSDFSLANDTWTSTGAGMVKIPIPKGLETKPLKVQIYNEATTSPVDLVFVIESTNRIKINVPDFKSYSVITVEVKN